MSQEQSKSRTNPVRIALSLAAGLLVAWCCISSQSFWMDEGSTIFKALMPNIREWWQLMMHLGGSDVQMPVYMFLVWCWHHLGATSEVALRWINAPWLLIGTIALSRQRFWPLVFLLSPFVWYYTGELRPYGMQIAASTVAALALWSTHQQRENRQGFGGLHLAAAAGLLLSASSLTSAVWAAGLWIGILTLRPDWLWKSGFWLRLSPWLLVCCGLGGFYLYTVFSGYRAAGEGGGLASMAFGFYELIGLSGLGPGRNEIRSHPKSLIPHLMVLIPAGFCITYTWMIGSWNWWQRSGRSLRTAILLSVLVPLCFLGTVGVLMEFRVLGRHLSPLLPAVLLPIAHAIDLSIHGRRQQLLMAACALLFLAASSLLLRFHPRHERDDYRTATAIGLKAMHEGKSIMWQADMNAARYYAYRAGGFPLVNAIQVWESNPPSSPMFAEMIMINRPDIRYRGEDHHKVMKEHYFEMKQQLPGFELWETR